MTCCCDSKMFSLFLFFFLRDADPAHVASFRRRRKGEGEGKKPGGRTEQDEPLRALAQGEHPTVCSCPLLHQEVKTDTGIVSAFRGEEEGIPAPFRAQHIEDTLERMSCAMPSSKSRKNTPETLEIMNGKLLSRKHFKPCDR